MYPRIGSIDKEAAEVEAAAAAATSTSTAQHMRAAKRERAFQIGGGKACAQSSLCRTQAVIQLDSNN